MPFTSNPVKLDPHETIVNVGWGSGVYFALFIGAVYVRPAIVGDEFALNVRLENIIGIPHAPGTLQLILGTTPQDGLIMSGAGSISKTFKDMGKATAWRAPGNFLSNWVGKGRGELVMDGLASGLMFVNLSKEGASEPSFEFDIILEATQPTSTEIDIAGGIFRAPVSYVDAVDGGREGIQVNLRKNSDGTDQAPIFFGDGQSGLASGTSPDFRPAGGASFGLYSVHGLITASYHMTVTFPPPGENVFTGTTVDFHST